VEQVENDGREVFHWLCGFHSFCSQAYVGGTLEANSHDIVWGLPCE